MKKRIIATLIAIIVLCAPIAFFGGFDFFRFGKNANAKLKIGAVGFACYDIAKNISSKYGDISYLDQDNVAAFLDANPKGVIIVYLGNLVQPQADYILKNASQKDLTIFDLSERAYYFGNPPATNIWLDAGNMKIMSENYKRKIVERDTAHNQFYQRNFESYKKSLDEMDDHFHQALKPCSRGTILYPDDLGFNYLFKRYSLRSQQSDLAEPLNLDNMTSNEGRDLEKDDYLSVMNKNLSQIKVILKCNE